MSPSDDIDMWIKFANLCRKNGRHSMSQKILGKLMSGTADEVRGKELPVLVVVGEHDPALGEETVRQTWLPLFPNARLEVAANAGHYPMFEAPVNLATLVERFLRG